MESHTQSNANADVFRRLPTDILLKIIKLCPGFTTLQSLLIATRTWASLFDNNAHQITEFIMASSVPEQIQASMRAVLRLRTRTHRCRNRSDVKDLLLDDKTMTPLRDIIQEAALLRKFVALAHQIHAISHVCLEHYMDKFQSVEPSRPSDPQFYYKMHDLPRDPWLRRPPGERYQLPDLQPPIWIEEQRVLMCLWRMQGFYELQIAREKGWLDWTTEEVVDLEATSVLDFYNFDGRYPRDLLLTVIDFIDTLRPKSPNTHWFELSHISSANSHFSFICSPEPHFGGSEKQDNREPARLGLNGGTWTWRFFALMASPAHYTSPLQYCEFTPYRKYGFAIWDKERMVNSGFLPERREDMFLYTRPDPYWFTWRSILSKEEDEAVGAATPRYS